MPVQRKASAISRSVSNSRHPLITVETPEEERLEQMLLEVATELGVPLYEWTVTAGLAKYRGGAIYNTEQPEQALANIPLIQGDTIFLLKDSRGTIQGGAASDCDFRRVAAIAGGTCVRSSAV